MVSSGGAGGPAACSSTLNLLLQSVLEDSALGVVTVCRSASTSEKEETFLLVGRDNDLRGLLILVFNVLRKELSRLSLSSLYLMPPALLRFSESRMLKVITSAAFAGSFISELISLLFLPCSLAATLTLARTMCLPDSCYHFSPCCPMSVALRLCQWSWILFGGQKRVSFYLCLSGKVQGGNGPNLRSDRVASLPWRSPFRLRHDWRNNWVQI